LDHRKVIFFRAKKIERESRFSDRLSFESEQREYDRVNRMAKDKDIDGLGKWLDDYSKKGPNW
jgi:hypothetical protein